MFKIKVEDKGKYYGCQVQGDYEGIGEVFCAMEAIFKHLEEEHNLEEDEVLYLYKEFMKINTQMDKGEDENE